MVTAILLLGLGRLEFMAPTPLTANGKAISVDTGHAAPACADLDGDGVEDLLIGQFGEGKARVYKNHGESHMPAFKGYTFLQAGGKTATVDYG
jgi:hypothetical protein